MAEPASLSLALSGFVGSPETAQVVETADEARRAVVDSVCSRSSSDEACAGALERYLSLVRNIASSFQSSAAASYTDDFGQDASALFTFRWRSGLSRENKYQVARGLYAEASMAMAGLAFAKARMAIALAQKESPDLKLSAQILCEAAGVLDALSRPHRPAGEGPAGGATFDTGAPLETSEAFCEGIRDVIMSAAHRVTLAKAIDGGASNALRARLCAGYAATLDGAINNMRARAGVEFEKLRPELRSCLAFHLAAGNGLMWYFQALADEEAARGGAAVHAVRRAAQYLRERPGPTSHGHPPLDGVLEDLRRPMDALQELVREAEERIEHDNNTVYFDAVPESAAPPEPATVMRASPFAVAGAGMGDEIMLDFVKPEHSVDLGYGPSIAPTAAIGAPVSAAEVAEAAGAAPAAAAESAAVRIERSDSDLARELQARLDAGEDV